MLPQIPVVRVKVNEQAVDPFDVLGTRRPRVQIDATEIDDPRKTLFVGHAREARCAASRKLRMNHLEPDRIRTGSTLLVEEVAIDAVRKSFH